ncbi:putative pterin-4-alpha-carbinolamine dehydratase [Clavispora lusitaniae]|uniref:Pterin-4-alpha-carbinolamine dehydratase n=1 Tax=Clavispora lusitaniae TaxID=36911 RepID=A0ACD0WDB1_CLALS|nr:putative pterin-4-alpha-carbinolamine dehydratase [Clavispora lusitaniae]QFZ31442.1 putative pterin-4-alpha-carbinolamine dehydratase [Clavispora lusitaniae]QFZ37110.1 putative pterin-4-alpha-carbinolamine dehydratase [Clavispora lusitaniae]QFZ42794.1 putative pterin-4-alpha-carbinolamine dehydratase [Clavispora lusitaniae]QFZ48470.1 putative pterin-4-alpha-carbinolamine dehydratase [Clavispora lusitaniae]
MKQTLTRLAARASALTREEITKELEIINKQLPNEHWSAQFHDSSSEIRATYKLKTFAKTWEFLNMIALQAQRLRHHPTITNTYNKIDLVITTHDAGNHVTDLDVKLAQAVHTAYAKNFVEQTPIKNESKNHNDSRASKIIEELTRKNGKK